MLATIENDASVGRPAGARAYAEMDAFLNAARVPVIVLTGTRNGATLLYPALRCVRSCGQTSQICEKGTRLADK